MHGNHWQTDNYRAAVSYLTGRTILVNTDPQRFLIPRENWNGAEVRRRIEALKRRWALLSSHLRPSNILLTHVLAFHRAETVQQFGAELDSLLAERKNWHMGAKKDKQFWLRSPWKRDDRTRIKELITEFWVAGALALPIREGIYPGAKIAGEQLAQVPLFAAIDAMIPDTGRRDVVVRTQHIVAAMLMRTCGLREIGDLTPDVIRDLFGRFHSHHLRKPISAAIIEIQRNAHGEAVRHSSDDFGSSRRVTLVRDLKFGWVVDRDAAMEEWRTLGAAYIAQLPTSLGVRKQAITLFFKHLLANPSLPRSPGDYLKRGADLRPAFAPRRVSMNNYVADFLDWVLDTKFASEGEDGRPIRFPGKRNPIARLSMAGRNLGETFREAMPTRYIRMALEILTENEWSWAKRGRGDWFDEQNAETGKWQKTWSPVRACALYVKLRMPFRTFQVRTMDDGSSDTYVYDEVKGIMVPNPSLLRQGNARTPIQRGVLQAITDRKTGRSILHICLTTNKTADINRESWQKGYRCPWAPDDVVKLLADLRRWQQKHNPISEPTPWRKVREFSGTKTDFELAGLKSCFLFRDPTERVRRNEPISDGKLIQLWHRLLEELERRLAAQGTVGPDDQPIKLIASYSSTGLVSSGVYDLHSLRVSLITNLLQTNEVSAEVMMKVVGHATVVMTLYYVKHGPSQIADCLSAADAKMIHDEQHNWIRHMRSQALKDVVRAVARTSEAGVAAFSSSSPSSLMVVNIGLCPVGGALCHKGGTKLSSGKRESYFAAVPGGRSNCAGCRFIISGEPWLHGIHCEFNVRSFEAAGLSRKREKLEAAFESLDAQRRACETTGEPFSQHREWERASNDREEVDARFAQLGLEMANLWALKDQVERIIEEHRKEGCAKHALVVGDVEAVQAALEESTEWELADRVCKASVIYPSIAARGNLPQYANEFRLRRYDRILRKNGLQPRFLDMDEETALYVGNRLSSFLMLRVGRENTLRLMEGGATFETLRATLLPEEFRRELDTALDGLVAQPFLIDRHRAERRRKHLATGE